MLAAMGESWSTVDSHSDTFFQQAGMTPGEIRSENLMEGNVTTGGTRYIIAGYASSAFDTVLPTSLNCSIMAKAPFNRILISHASHVPSYSFKGVQRPGRRRMAS
jgi:hypothetical protein